MLYNKEKGEKMRIAICDDCHADIEKLEKLIKESCFCPINIEFFEFSDGKLLLKQYDFFDVLFLDIQMETSNGSIVGERVRKIDPDVMIFFYTGYDMNASRILRARPQGYLMKDMDNKEMMLNIDSILKILSEKLEKKLPIVGDGKMVVVNISDILYISILNKGSKIWITDQAANKLGILKKEGEDIGIKSPVKLNEYYKKLKAHGFLYGSKSYIINANHIHMRLNNVVRLSGGQELTISRSRKAEFDKEFGHYWGICYNRERKKQNGI